MQHCDGTRRAQPGDHAPDQAHTSDRAGAGDNERTAPTKGTKPVRIWVTLAVTGPQLSAADQSDGGPLIQVIEHESKTHSAEYPSGQLTPRAVLVNEAAEDVRSS